jgi:hypothetical protein
VYTLTEPTPIFHRPDLLNLFHKEGLLFDEKGLLRALEYIALPGTTFEVVGRAPEHPHILEIRPHNYPSIKRLYLDERFGWEKGKRGERRAPRKEVVLERLWNFPRSIYVWGGNYVLGIDKMIELYPPPPLTPFEELYWRLQGVDCSGLYYEVLEGTVPRNTSELRSFGKEIAVSSLEPLDILIWEGHMVIVLDGGKVIESCHADGGVIMRDLSERLAMIDHSFTCRRCL